MKRGNRTLPSFQPVSDFEIKLPEASSLPCSYFAQKATSPPLKKSDASTISLCLYFRAEVLMNMKEKATTFEG